MKISIRNTMLLTPNQVPFKILLNNGLVFNIVKYNNNVFYAENTIIDYCWDKNGKYHLLSHFSHGVDYDVKEVFK